MTSSFRTTLRPLALVCFAFALVYACSPAARAQQSDPPRRTQGPAAGPVIKLPRGAGATDEEPQQTATAKGVAARDSAPQKWEYCAIVNFSSRLKGFNTLVATVIINYFPSGVEEVEGTSELGPLATAMAKLGDVGWELVAVLPGNGSSSPAYYFKRPKRQE